MKNENLFIETSLPKPLNKEQVYKSLKQYQNGNIEAREKLIIHNIRLVINQVNKKFNNTPYDKKELVSVGLIGLIKSIDTFNITKNVEFSTYAVTCITNEILMYIRQNKKYINFDSLDRPIFFDKEGSELKLKDILIDEHSNFIEAYETKESIMIIRNLVESLEERDKKIIMLYFGFYNDIQYNQKEISQILNLSQSYVSRLIKTILLKLETKLLEQERIKPKKKLKIKESNI